MFHPFFTNDFVAAASELSHATQRSGINSAFCNVPTKVTDITSQQRRYFSEKHVSENFSRRNFAETKKVHTFALAKTKRGVAQLVAFLVWDQAVAGSSPVTPTLKGKSSVRLSFFVFIHMLHKRNGKPHTDDKQGCNSLSVFD